jgi:hypothetical protein
MSVGGDPVIRTVNTVPNQAQLFLCLVLTFGAEPNNAIIEDDTTWIYGILFNNWGHDEGTFLLDCLYSIGYAP